jgi:hypothetical protein
MFDEFSSVVSHKAEFFFPLYPIRKQFLFRCITHRKRIFCVVSHKAEGSVLLWDTAEKNDRTQNNILNFRCLSLTSEESVDKSSYLKIQTNSWRERNIFTYIYMVSSEQRYSLV